jgi:hypothetical protein
MFAGEAMMINPSFQPIGTFSEQEHFDSYNDLILGTSQWVPNVSIHFQVKWKA